MSQAFAVLRGGRNLGQAADAVTEGDIIRELESRGYVQQVYHAAPIHHAAPVLTKHMAISVAVDEALLYDVGIPHTTTHPFRCPSGTCQVPESTWKVVINWCVGYANGLLSGKYALPAWAKTALAQGKLQGIYLSGLGDISTWMKENPWVIESVGDVLKNYGDYLTSKQVKEAIEANVPKGALTKDDIPTLVAMLQQGGFIPEGKTQEVAKGATEAASAMPGWMMPVMIGAAAIIVLMLMKK